MPKVTLANVMTLVVCALMFYFASQLRYFAVVVADMDRMTGGGEALGDLLWPSQEVTDRFWREVRYEDRYVADGEQVQRIVTVTMPRDLLREYEGAEKHARERIAGIVVESGVVSAKTLREDAAFGGLVILPVSALITYLLFLVTRERPNLANIVTVYCGVVGVLALFYFLWRA